MRSKHYAAACFCLLAAAVAAVLTVSIIAQSGSLWPMAAAILSIPWVCIGALTVIALSPPRAIRSALLENLLAEIWDSRARGTCNSRSLIRFRLAFRQIIRRRPVKALCRRANPFEYPVDCRIAVWLLGRCSGHAGAEVLAKFRSTPELPLRKEIIRALKRKESWQILREIERTEPDPRLRRMAHQTAPTSYESRLSAYASRTAPQPVGPNRQSLYVRAGIDNRAGRWPKSSSVIRRILERIRFLVHGT